VRYYVDFEFEDDMVLPLSIGIVSQDGRELYIVRPDWLGVVTTSKNYEWLKEHVVPHLERASADETEFTAHWSTRIEQFIGDDLEPQFWGYFSDYDWVLFCQLFGRMVDLPEHFPKFCLDLKQLAISCGVKESLKKLVPIKDEHNALADARWMRTIHGMLIIQYGRDV
jgi:hypothetical protein